MCLILPTFYSYKILRSFHHLYFCPQIALISSKPFLTFPTCPFKTSPLTINTFSSEMQCCYPVFPKTQPSPPLISSLWCKRWDYVTYLYMQNYLYIHYSWWHPLYLYYVFARSSFNNIPTPLLLSFFSPDHQHLYVSALSPITQQPSPVYWTSWTQHTSTRLLANISTTSLLLPNINRRHPHRHVWSTVAHFMLVHSTYGCRWLPGPRPIRYEISLYHHLCVMLMSLLLN